MALPARKSYSSEPAGRNLALQLARSPTSGCEAQRTSGETKARVALRVRNLGRAEVEYDQLFCHAAFRALTQTISLCLGCG